jgi:hypothetical protein
LYRLHHALVLVLSFTTIEGRIGSRIGILGAVIAAFLCVAFCSNGRRFPLIGVGGTFGCRIMLLRDQAEAILDSVGAEVQAMQVCGEDVKVMVLECGGLV